jgi:hypothetical protein
VRGVVLGAGFYGAMAALRLRALGWDEVWLIDEEPGIMRRASWFNQARVHAGFHYPRAFATAWRAQASLDRFRADFPSAVVGGFRHVYAVAARGSRITAGQFRRFADAIGAPLEPLPRDLKGLFAPGMVEEAFLVEEPALDAAALRAETARRLTAAEVRCRFGVRGRIRGRGVDLADGTRLDADLVINATYGGLTEAGVVLRAGLRRELTELAAVVVPPALEGLAITVMDGPFWSLMPFPARPGIHTLSHVRWTPRGVVAPGADAQAALAALDGTSGAEEMRRDAARFCPAVGQVRIVGSHWAVKAVLLAREGDDGRPVLFEPSASDPMVVSILGGKIDTVYDALDALDAHLAAPGR